MECENEGSSLTAQINTTDDDDTVRRHTPKTTILWYMLVRPAAGAVYLCKNYILCVLRVPLKTTCRRRRCRRGTVIPPLSHAATIRELEGARRAA